MGGKGAGPPGSASGYRGLPGFHRDVAVTEVLRARELSGAARSLEPETPDVLRRLVPGARARLQTCAQKVKVLEINRKISRNS